jgi:hypothetical protein
VDGEPERVVPVIDRDPVIDRPLASRPDDITDDITQTTHVDEVEIQITYGDWTLLDTGAIADAVERAADAITSDARLFLEITAGSANPWADPGSGASDDDEDEGGTVGGDGDSDGDEGAGNWGDGGGGARMAGEAETPFQPTIGATWDEVIVAPGADATDGSDGGVDAFAPIEPATIEAPFE